MSDLLVYYKAILGAWEVETGSGGTNTLIDNPLRNVRQLLTPHISLDPDAGSEIGGQWYGAGWAIAELPAPLGSIGSNGMFVPSMPLVGRGCKSDDETKPKRTVWYHNGSLVGFFSSVHILPETGTVVVVLVNSLPKNDCADWIGQMLVEEMLGCPEKNDYVALARESPAAYDTMWTKLQNDLDLLQNSQRGPGSSSTDYTGRYYNKIGNWYIEVTRDKEGLGFSFQGRSTQRHRLQPYDADTFAWPLTEAQSRKRGRWPDLDVPTYLFHFGFDDETGAAILRWEHDPDVQGGERFYRAVDSQIPQQNRAEL